MGISWTKYWAATDDGSAVTGAQLKQLQDDITTGLPTTVPTPTASDALKVARVKADYSDYELADLAMTVPVFVEFADGSAAQTVYAVSPVAGNVTVAYVNTWVANRGATYTVTLGSAGVTIASATVASTGVAGQVTTMTLGTVTCTAGMSIGVTRGVTGTTGASSVAIVITKTFA